MAADDFHTRILAAARHRLQSTGLRGINVSSVATAAGVSRPTVYRYVGDAEEIVRELIDRELTSFFDDIAPVMNRDAPLVDRFVEALRFTVAFARDSVSPPGTPHRGDLNRPPHVHPGGPTDPPTRRRPVDPLPAGRQRGR